MAETPRVYLDTCCIQRLMDDQDQERVRNETRGVQMILTAFDRGLIRVLTSKEVYREIGEDGKLERRLISLLLLSSLEKVHVDPETHGQLVKRIAGIGLAAGDSAHLAYAYLGGATAFLICDDGIIKKAGALKPVLPGLEIAGVREYITVENAQHGRES